MQWLPTRITLLQGVPGQALEGRSQEFVLKILITSTPCEKFGIFNVLGRCMCWEQ